MPIFGNSAVGRQHLIFLIFYQSLKTMEIMKCLVINLLILTRKLVSLCFKDTRCGCTPKHIVRITSAVILCDLSNAKGIVLSAPVRQNDSNVPNVHHNLTSLSWRMASFQQQICSFGLLPQGLLCLRILI